MKETRILRTKIKNHIVVKIADGQNVSCQTSQANVLAE